MKLSPIPVVKICLVCGCSASYNVMAADNICEPCVSFGRDCTNANSLEEIVAKRLKMLASRVARKLPIMRCESTTKAGTQCPNFSEGKRGKSNLCKRHMLHAATGYDLTLIEEELHASR